MTTMAPTECFAIVCSFCVLATQIDSRQPGFADGILSFGEGNLALKAKNVR